MIVKVNECDSARRKYRVQCVLQTKSVIEGKRMIKKKESTEAGDGKDE